MKNEFSRRSFLKGSAAVAAIGAMGVPVLADEEPMLIAPAPTGDVSDGSAAAAAESGELSYPYNPRACQPVFVDAACGGLVGLSYGGVNVFKGIPYADHERFEEPVPVTWEGYRQANRYTEICPQNFSAVNGQEVQNLCNYIVPGEKTCLSVNVWTPSVDPNAKLPVIFWIHGGGYTSGSSAEHRIYEGYNLAKYGNVVFVSVNHRLNCLGFLDLSEYGEQYKNSGNLSFVDLVCALQWVKDNIAAFGGDPDCVTIEGQSGGGGKVATLMGMPAADGLFHRAVAQSGGSFGGGRTPEAAKEQTEALREYLGLEKDEFVAALKAMTWDELNAACSAVRFSANPVADGEYYLGSCEHSAGKIPLMRTNVFSEFFSNAGSLYYGPVWASKEAYFENYFPALSDDEVKKKYADKYKEDADAIMEEFLKAYPEKKAVDGLFVTGRNNDWVTAYTEAGGTAYQAVVAYNQPLLGGITPIHTGGDIFLFFRNTLSVADYWVIGDEENAEKVSMTMADALCAFAATGDPSTESLPWAPFSVENGETMIFDHESFVSGYHDKKLQELLAPYTFSFF